MLSHAIKVNAAAAFNFQVARRCVSINFQTHGALATHFPGAFAKAALSSFPGALRYLASGTFTTGRPQKHRGNHGKSWEIIPKGDWVPGIHHRFQGSRFTPSCFKLELKGRTTAENQAWRPPGFGQAGLQMGSSGNQGQRSSDLFEFLLYPFWQIVPFDDQRFEIHLVLQSKEAFKTDSSMDLESIESIYPVKACSIRLAMGILSLLQGCPGEWWDPTALGDRYTNLRQS